MECHHHCCKKHKPRTDSLTYTTGNSQTCSRGMMFESRYVQENFIFPTLWRPTREGHPSSCAACTVRSFHVDKVGRALTLILRRSRMGTVWFYTSTSNKRAARPKLYTKSLTRDLKRKYSRLTLVRISINL